MEIELAKEGEKTAKPMRDAGALNMSELNQHLLIRCFSDLGVRA